MRVSLCYAMSRAGTTTTDAMAQQQQAQQQQAQQQQTPCLARGVGSRARVDRRSAWTRTSSWAASATARRRPLSRRARTIAMRTRRASGPPWRCETCEALLPRLGGWSCEDARQLQRHQLRSPETCTGVNNHRAWFSESSRGVTLATDDARPVMIEAASYLCVMRLW